MVYSGSASFAATAAFFVLARLLDDVMDPTAATLIASVMTSFLDLILQYHVLYGRKRFDYNILYKYPVGHAIDIAVTYFGFKFLYDRREKFVGYLPDELRPHYNTVARVVVEMFHFFFVAYPIRRYWIFA